MNLDVINRFSGSTSLLFKGSYDVEDFIKNKNTIMTGSDALYRWKFVYISPEAGYISIRTENDSVQYFSYFLSTADKTINMKNYSYQNNLFTYDEQEPGKIILTGKFSNDSLKVELRKKDGGYNLVNRGFHWINEYPFNR